MVTDQYTGRPITRCGIVSGHRYSRTDLLGWYVIGVRRQWKTMQVIAPGYEKKTVAFDAAESRRPIINVQLTPQPAAPNGG